ncbi:ACT domain-containing protein [Amycolatopsis benzoatilytica]|uniref:ACT domain-containing protein n=1 Tax=Amycolatopsis benzoatilytica TaxID=346045 RepID=UPI00037AE85F|nr:ACT domain-containing protein [Amycolatopsis benzoatilytica]
MKHLTIDLRPDAYSVVRLPADAPVPADLLEPGQPGLVSVTRTPDELSVICPSGREPRSATVENAWRLFTVRGPLEFTLTGIISALASELAAAGVALFSLSTYDTDHILVRADDLDRAAAAFREAGHEVLLPG